MLKNINKVNIQLMCLLKKKSFLFNFFNYYYCNKYDNTLKHIHYRDFNFKKIKFINNPLNYNYNFVSVFFLFKDYLKNS